VTKQTGKPAPDRPSAEVGNDGALPDSALDQVSGGTDPAPGTTSNVMKTKHDTVKNSISNVR